MISYKVEPQDKKWPVCQMTINGITRSSRLCGGYYIKSTSCCRKLKAVHHKCTLMFSSKIDSNYKFDASAYEGDQQIKLLCMECSVNFSSVTIDVTAL